MRKFTAFFVVLILIILNVIIPINAEYAGIDYLYYSDLGITDIEDHWARDSINSLIDLEIVGGYPDDTFRPDNQITRAEYMTILFKTVCVLDESIVSEDHPDYSGNLDIYSFRANNRRVFLKKFPTVEYNLSYTDMDEHWAKNYVAWVKNFCDKKNPGFFDLIFSGSNFNPDIPITREEAALVTTGFITEPVRSRGIEFKDVSSDHAFYDEIMKLIDNEIINGFPDGTFKPEENITRAATAVIMTNVLKEIAYNSDFFANPDT